MTTGRRCGASTRRATAAGLDGAVADASGRSARRRRSRRPAACGSAPASRSIRIARAWGWRPRRSRAARRSSSDRAATKVRAGARQVDVALDGGLVRAQTVIVTTGTATAEFKPLRRHFKPREQYLVLTEPVPAAIRKQLAERDVTISDTATPRHRVRWTRDDRLLVAGATRTRRRRGNATRVLVQRTGQLMYELLMMYPAISGLQPEYGWERLTARPPTGSCTSARIATIRAICLRSGRRFDHRARSWRRACSRVRRAGEPDKHDEVFGWTR